MQIIKSKLAGLKLYQSQIDFNKLSDFGQSTRYGVHTKGINHVSIGQLIIPGCEIFYITD